MDQRMEVDEDIEHLAYLLAMLVAAIDPQANRPVTYAVLIELLTTEGLDERDMAKFGRTIRDARRTGSDPHVH
jgi:hypothetical protein